MRPSVVKSLTSTLIKHNLWSMCSWRSRIRNIVSLPVCSLSFLASQTAAFNFPRATVVVASWLSERKEVETHADCRAPSFFFFLWCVGGVCVCPGTRRSGWTERRGGAALPQILRVIQWNWSLLFLKPPLSSCYSKLWDGRITWSIQGSHCPCYVQWCSLRTLGNVLNFSKVK